MKSVLKNCFVTGILVICLTVTAFAATKSRTTDYSMSAGVYSSSMDIKKGGELKVKMMPNVSKSYDCPITIYVDQKKWYGWAGSGLNSKTVNSHEQVTKKFTVKDKATYRVYLSSPHRVHVEGEVKFTWEAQ